MTSQKSIFLSGEGDAWFERNLAALGHKGTDLVVSEMLSLQVQPKLIAEIGCGEGERLSLLRDTFGSACWGFDPSTKAVAHGRATYPDITFEIGTADRIDLPDSSVDTLIFGFCLYLTDPRDYFKIAAEADRVLADGGLVAILDFSPRHVFKNPYSPKPGVFAHKMDFSRFFTWNPAYRLISRRYTEHGTSFTYDENESICLDFVKKDWSKAFPKSPQY